MGVDITEFVEIDPEHVDAVFKAANGTPFLMIKQVADDDADDKPDGDADDKAEKMEFCGDPSCEVCLSRASKGKLSMEQRRKIPKSSYALPDKAPESGSYPINDKAHARNALSRVAQHGTPEEKARVRRAVASKFPGIGKGKKKSKKGSSQQENEHGSTPSPSSLQGQTKANRRGLATNKDVTSDRPSGQPKTLDAGPRGNAEGEGHGDTAADKDIHKEEAEVQTSMRVAEQQGRQTASKAGSSDGLRHDMHEGRGDVNPEDVPLVSGPATGQLQAQTEGNKRKKGGGSNVTSDQMARQSEMAAKGGFKFKLKKKGKKKNKKKAPFQMVGALKQNAPERVVSVANATKELDDMTGAELAETFVSVLDARDARKAEERKAKKAKAKKRAAKKAKAKKAVATTVPEGEEAAQEAAKSFSPEMFVEGVGAAVEKALKTELAPLWGRMAIVENQPARPRLAANNLAGKEPVMRDQAGGKSPMDVLKPLEDAYKSEKDPSEKAKKGNELTLAKLTISERIRLGHPVSAADAKALAAAGQ